jgi:N-acetylmuramoyl-L-alanine amidase
LISRFGIILLVLALLVPVARSGVSPFEHEGQRFVRLDELASFYRAPLIPGADGMQASIRSSLAGIGFTYGRREARIGDTVVWMHEPMDQARGSWVIREVDALTVIDPIMRPAEYLRGVGHRVVLLDPGHGALDSGAKGRRGMEEKTAALDIAQRTRRYLVGAGMDVRMTRESDEFIKLEDRAALASWVKADMMVSIHLNSAENRTARGIETFVLAAEGQASTYGGSRRTHATGNHHNAGNAALGFQLQRALVEKTDAYDRGLRRARFIVLRNAPCPAALVECGFLSNPDDEALIMQGEYRDRIARGIANGILRYVTLAKKAKELEKP